MNVTYNILRGVEVPSVVHQSNRWRKLRHELADAKTDETVVVHLSSDDYPNFDAMQKATESARAGAYGFSSSAKLYKNKLVIRTSAVNVADLTESKFKELEKLGVKRADRLLVIKKTRDETLPDTAPAVAPIVVEG